MCEPTHSISQFPPEPPGGFGGGYNDNATKLSKLLSWGRKVFKWLHFSKLGSGHSAAESTFSNHLWFPENTKYEAEWWNRNVRLDGHFVGDEFDRSLALQAADGYAHQVSIGNLTMLRRFLAVSMQKSDRPGAYLTRFLEDFLRKEGRDDLQQRLKRLFNISSETNRLMTLRSSDPCLESVIKVMLSFTRKRNLIHEAWADDTKLWTPDQQGLQGQPVPLLI